MLNDRNICFEQLEFNSSDLLSQLNGIFEWHEKSNPNIANSLNPGLSQIAFKKIEHELGYNLPLDLRTLYSWRNGSSSAGQWIWYHRFVSIEEAIGLREKANREFSWLDKYLPFLEFENEYIFIDLESNSRGNSPVFLAFPGMEFVQFYTSVTSLFTTSLNLLECPNLVEVELETNSLIVEDKKKVKEIYDLSNQHTVFPYRI